MAKLTIEVKDVVMDRVEDAFAVEYGWTAQIPNKDFKPALPESEENPSTIPNPVSRRAHLLQCLRNHVIQKTANHESRVEAQEMRRRRRDLAKEVN